MWQTAYWLWSWSFGCVQQHVLNKLIRKSNWLILYFSCIFLSDSSNFLTVYLTTARVSYIIFFINFYGLSPTACSNTDTDSGTKKSGKDLASPTESPVPTCDKKKDADKIHTPSGLLTHNSCERRGSDMIVCIYARWYLRFREACSLHLQAFWKTVSSQFERLHALCAFGHDDRHFQLPT